MTTKNPEDTGLFNLIGYTIRDRWDNRQIEAFRDEVYPSEEAAIATIAQAYARPDYNEFSILPIYAPKEPLPDDETPIYAQLLKESNAKEKFDQYFPSEGENNDNV
jgi:hypothetical protein